MDKDKASTSKKDRPLTFDEAMRKIVTTPKAHVEKAIEKAKKKKLSHDRLG